MLLVPPEIHVPSNESGIKGSPKAIGRFSGLAVETTDPTSNSTKRNVHTLDILRWYWLPTVSFNIIRPTSETAISLLSGALECRDNATSREQTLDRLLSLIHICHAEQKWLGKEIKRIFDTHARTRARNKLSQFLIDKYSVTNKLFLYTIKLPIWKV